MSSIFSIPKKLTPIAVIIVITTVIMIITMQVDSCDKLATDQVEASKPYWDTQVRMLMIVVMMIIMGHHDHDHNDDGG